MKSNPINEIPSNFLIKWQEIADLIASIINIPSALIMKAENEFMEVLISSNTETNPYHIGYKEKLNGLYCEAVVNSQEKLLIPNALKDKDWDKNPAIKFGMIAYLGFPINFPDNQPFGTICILDNKDNPSFPEHEKLMLHFKKVIELDLSLMHTFEYKINELSHTISELQSQLLTKNIELNTANQKAERKEIEFIRIQEKLIKTKEQAQESEEKYRTFYNNAPLSYQSLDENGCFIDVNPMWLKTLGCERDEVIGKWYGDFLHPDYVEHFKTNFPAFKKRGYISDVQFKLRKKDNTFIVVSFEGCIGYTPEGKFKQTYCVFKDVTEQKALEQHLLKSKEKAEESDRLKSAFLANMSHEIRTPMNGILGFANLLKKTDLKGEKRHKYIEIIEKSGKRMLNIINDIVDISKIEAGLMELDINESNINDQIEYIYTFFKPEAEDKGIKLSFKKTLPAKEAIIKTDSEKLNAILTNLVKNAIKYTEKGSIEFGYNLKTNAKPGELEFYVKDTGIGNPEDRKDAIFDRFIQADIANKMAHQGAGLGLSITKAYVEMLGGKIWVDSEEGNGSTFYFTIPYNT